MPTLFLTLTHGERDRAQALNQSSSALGPALLDFRLVERRKVDDDLQGVVSPRRVVIGAQKPAMLGIFDYLRSLRTDNNYVSGIVNLVSSFIFQVFLILYTIFVLLIGRIYRAYRRRKTKRRILNANTLSYGHRNLLVLSGSEFEIRRSDLTTYRRIRDDFFIEFPRELRQEMLDVKPDYAFRDANGSPVLDDLKREAMDVLPDLESIIERARLEAARLTINRAKQSTRVFNGSTGSSSRPMT